LFEERTGTLFCSDLLGQLGDGPAMTRGDIVGPALESEGLWRSMAVTVDTLPTIERLAALDPQRLAIMHGSSLEGGCAAPACRPLRSYCLSFSRNMATAHW
jgi:hypothetical protein